LCEVVVKVLDVGLGEVEDGVTERGVGTIEIGVVVVVNVTVECKFGGDDSPALLAEVEGVVVLREEVL